MYFYKAVDENSNYIGVANSFNLMYYNAGRNRFYKCGESSAEYIYVNGDIYHIATSHEPKEGYPQAFLLVIDQTEYEKLVQK